MDGVHKDAVKGIAYVTVGMPDDEVRARDAVVIQSSTLIPD